MGLYATAVENEKAYEIEDKVNAYMTEMFEKLEKEYR